jgi:hypothetical protein
MSDQINISKKYIEGKCDLKCAYNFKYTNNSAIASNSGNAISVDMESTNELPVLYNKQKYTPTSLRIIYPSMVLYNDKLPDAEIYILHIPEKGGKMLLVLIPIKISTDSTTATIQLTNIIKSVSVSAPSEGGKVTIPEINLQNIVPNKPFFNFDYSTSYDCIAFSYLDAIPISSSNIDTLKKIIKPTTTQFRKKNGGGLFYNSSGPNTTTTLGEGIYISCNPTGNSIDTKEVTYEKNDTVYDISNILDDPTFILVIQTIIACLVFIVIFYIWNYGYNFIDGEFGNQKSSNVKK